jgi:hypothetical protein
VPPTVALAAGKSVVSAIMQADVTDEVSTEVLFVFHGVVLCPSGISEPNESVRVILATELRALVGTLVA